ncbi:MAG: RNase adapter RapZ [Proteobacteria bacterium]|nr:RNase adapter RapZ [Pseudomonadota bacterium]
MVVLSGPSGAGKSTALKVLEDLGFFCVDNMPVMLLPGLLEHLDISGDAKGVAVVVDIRDKAHIDEFPSILESIKSKGRSVELVFLDATDEAIIKRFSVTRRPHPMSVDGASREGIELEREVLKDMKSAADKFFDTTDFNVHQLKKTFQVVFSGATDAELMSINLLSFGYRYGIPIESDLVMDVRFLTNPYFVEELKALSGTDERVRDFVLGLDETTEFLDRYKGLLDYLIPLYLKEGKSNLSIAIGCTGGMHRSVAIAERLAEVLRESSSSMRINIRHRDIDKS